MKVNSGHWDLWSANKMQQHYRICLQKRQGAEYGMHMIRELVILCFMIWIHIKQMKQSGYLKIIKQKEQSRYIGYYQPSNTMVGIFYAKIERGGNACGRKGSIRNLQPGRQLHRGISDRIHRDRDKLRHAGSAPRHSPNQQELLLPEEKD